MFPERAMKRCFLRALNYMAEMVESPWVDLQGQRAVKTQFQDPKHIDVLRSHHLQALLSLPSSRRGAEPALLGKRDKVGPVPSQRPPPLLRPEEQTGFTKGAPGPGKSGQPLHSCMAPSWCLFLRDVNRRHILPTWKTTGLKLALSSPPKLSCGCYLILSFFLV